MAGKTDYKSNTYFNSDYKSELATVVINPSGY